MSLWDRFCESAQHLVASGTLDEIENDYKVAQGRKLAAARNAFLNNEASWVDELDQGLVSNLFHYINRKKLIDWIRNEPDNASAALRAIWADGAIDSIERVRIFCRFGLGEPTALRFEVLVIDAAPCCFAVIPSPLEEGVKD